MRLALTAEALAKVRGASPHQIWAFVCSSRSKKAIVVDAHISYDQARRQARMIGGIMRPGVVVDGAADVEG